jgi:hypothetical protein
MLCLLCVHAGGVASFDDDLAVAVAPLLLVDVSTAAAAAPHCPWDAVSDRDFGAVYEALLACADVSTPSDPARMTAAPAVDATAAATVTAARRQGHSQAQGGVSARKGSGNAKYASGAGLRLQQSSFYTPQFPSWLAVSLAVESPLRTLTRRHLRGLVTIDGDDDDDDDDSGGDGDGADIHAGGFDTETAGVRSPAAVTERLCAWLRAVLRLRVVDPSMGVGYFLLAVVHRITDAVVRVIDACFDASASSVELATTGTATVDGDCRDGGGSIDSGTDAIDGGGDASALHLLRGGVVGITRAVARSCVHGVDMDPLAVTAGMCVLWLACHPVTSASPLPLSNGGGFIGKSAALSLRHFAVGDSLSGVPTLRHFGVVSTEPASAPKSTTPLVPSPDDATDVVTTVPSSTMASRAHMRRSVAYPTDVDPVAVDSPLQLWRDFLATSASQPSSVSRRQSPLLTRCDDVISSAVGSEKLSPAARPLHWPLAFPHVFRGCRCDAGTSKEDSGGCPLRCCGSCGEGASALHRFVTRCRGMMSSCTAS